MLSLLLWDVLAYACLLVFMPSVLSLVIENHALLSWDQVTDLDSETYPTCLPWAIVE